MSYLATLSFDLQNGSREDYERAYSVLLQLGFSPTLRSDQRRCIRLPTTTCIGEFTGGDVAVVRDDLCNRVESALRAQGLTSKVFVSVGAGWAWGQRET